MERLLQNKYNTLVLLKLLNQLRVFKEKQDKNKLIYLINSYNLTFIDNKVKEFIEVNKSTEKQRTGNQQLINDQTIIPLKAHEFISNAGSTFHDFSRSIFNEYININKAFLLKIHDKISYLQKWKHILLKTNNNDPLILSFDREIIPLLDEIKHSVNKTIKDFIDNYDKKFNDLYNIIVRYLDSADPIVDNILKEYRKNKEYFLSKTEKLLSLYNIKYNFMEIITDSKFIMMYILKAVHFAIFVAALFLTEKLFLEMYMKKVYAENSDPPSLYNMLGILLLIDISFTLFMVTILVLITYIFNKPDNNFIINQELIISFLFDFALYTSFVMLISIIIASIVQLKRYFRYKTEGLRGIRAFKEIILGVAGSLTLIPFFAFQP